ncbi:MAG: hypothetical protein HY791_10800 [Deltaproteobacteria bacterium]|nr:hypothetical protein [Deltaproteobacteria bacterium]
MSTSSVFVREAPEGCLSDFALDRIAAELDPSPRHLEECARCRGRLSELAELKRAPLPPMASAARQRERRLEPRRLYPWAGLAALAASAVLFVRSPSGLRTKGSDFELGFFVRHGEGVRRGVDGEVVSVGDQLRFIYSAKLPGEVAIVSIDPANELSIYHPSGSETSTLALVGKDSLVANAIELDDSVGTERLIGIHCARRFRPLDVARQLVAGERVEACRSVELRVEKRR